MRFILFTKTKWDEAPGIRHQVARMLVANGHGVEFFERPRMLGSMRSLRTDGILFHGHGELLHHQLRFSSLATMANAWYERRQISRLCNSRDGERKIIINFCYDYPFLRELFPNTPLINLLHDDFLAVAVFPQEARRVYRMTVMNSDWNLAVSSPLVAQVNEFTEKASLFLPWARRAYSTPPIGLPRSAILYWGSINERLDFTAVKQILDSAIPIHFVGPVTHSRPVTEMLGHPNAHYHGTVPLDALTDVLAKCACSIVPMDPEFEYRTWARRFFGRTKSNGYNRAITINNRSFDLLSCGLPLLYSRLPALLSAPGDVIRVCDTGTDYIREFHAARDRFDATQPSIAEFVSGHPEAVRYDEFMTLCRQICDQAST